MEKQGRIIAIDGPAGAGKTTVARAIGQQLAFLHVDSGALYRIVTWQALLRGINCEDEAAVGELAAKLAVDVAARADALCYSVGGVEPGEAIRTPEINANVSPVAKAATVRCHVTAWLRAMRRYGDLVVEGRDIGSVVFPDSPARFYLDADVEERARRRHSEEQSKGLEQGQTRVLESLLTRDRIDSSRTAAPLRVADGAYKIDSTHLSIEQVVATILAHLPAEWCRN